MRRSQGGLAVIPMALVLALLWTLPALAAKTRLLLFPFALVNTSPVSTSPAERARLELLDAQLRAALEKSGKYALVDTAPVQAEMAALGNIRTCNGCELALARKLGATEVAYGWVQKVSTLILNINLLIEDTKSGKIVHGGSVDIRGDTDQSWTRGLAFLLQEHVFND
jgi:hypothetical protein